VRDADRNLLHDHVEQLERENAELKGENSELKQEKAALLERLAKLEEELRKSSRNSSKPPSSDGPAVPPRPKKPSTGRKPGGQPGHKRHERQLVPPEKVRTVVECVPERCDHCSAPLRGSDPEPERHQVTHLPPVEPITDEYRLHTLSCGECHGESVGKLPAGVPTGAFGPSVAAVVAVLIGAYRQSKRLVPGILFDLFGLRISVGAVVGCQQAASVALEAPVAEAQRHVKEQPIKHADETGWREGPTRARAWLWVMATHTVAVFMVHARRNTAAAILLLGTVFGVLVTDRHGAYNWWPDRQRQYCWAHLKRQFQTLSERGGESERIGKALLEEVGRLFHFWHRVRDGTLKRSSFRVYMRALRGRIEALLTEGAAIPHAKTSKMCRRLLGHTEALWTFVRVDGVQPTNNAGEQIIRHGVIMRKLSHGTMPFKVTTLPGVHVSPSAPCHTLTHPLDERRGIWFA
jgi:transposase